MKSILKATAVLSGASAVQILAGLVSAKVNAVLLGPEGLGLLSLLQGLVALTTLVASVGLGSGLVRAGAQALAEGDNRRAAALRRGAWLVCLALGVPTALLLVVFRRQVSYLMLGGAGHEGAVALMSVALLLSLAAGLQTGILNAHHRVADLARVSIWTSLLGVSASVAIIWHWRARGIPAAVCTTFVVSWAVAYYFMRRSVPAPAEAPARTEVWPAARSLLRFGVPFTASMLVGAGVQLLIPVLVLHTLGRAEVGFYRAAVAISVTYLGFLPTAMGQDYFPRVSAAAREPEVVARLINEQTRLVLLLAGPVILGMLALAPYLVRLVYAPAFTPAAEVLEWQLVGDLFKFAIWPVSIALLARRGSQAFFITELVGGVVLLAASWPGIRWLGLEGLGVSFMVMSIVHFAACRLVLRSDMSWGWTTGNKALFLTYLACAGVVRALPFVGLLALRTPVSLSLATLTGLLSLYLLRRELAGLGGLLGKRLTGLTSL